MYATTEQLAEYLHINEGDLPDNAERLLERASELIDYYTLNNIDEENTDHMKSAKKATCAQYEWWAETGDEFGLMGKVSSMSVGSFSYSAARNSLPKLSPRAQHYLFLEGLLYTGIKSKKVNRCEIT